MDNLNVAVVLMVLIAAIVSCDVSANVGNKSAQAGGPANVNWQDRFDLVLNLGTMIGVLATLVALLYAARNLSLSRKAAQGSCWLQLRGLFSEHQEVHLKLRNAKADEWLEPVGQKESPEWPKVEAYLGLFEHCKYLLEDGLIDEETFRRIYGYRINNILNSRRVVEERLIPLKGGWKSFHQLVKMLGGEVKCGSKIETERKLWRSEISLR